MMLLVMAGPAVDDFIEKLLPYVEPGDIIIDGGNSHYPDSNRRTKYLKEKGIRFVGTGVSGGEEGARYGPSLMPGGNEEAWPFIKDVFQSIAAKSDGEPCCDWVGDEGAGHYVKMVHNGIEYGDMQLITEVNTAVPEFLEGSLTFSGIRCHEARSRHELFRDGRCLREVEQGCPRLFLD
jgi:6-phosphogluconate dehydrogenase